MREQARYLDVLSPVCTAKIGVESAGGVEDFVDKLSKG
jgi:hypothetical protein